jgi:hypothetical protein
MLTASVLGELDLVVALDMIDDRELTVLGAHHGHVWLDEVFCRF